MTYEYNPRGVCSRKMIFNIEDGVIKSLEVVGGCNGNLKGISSLVTGNETPGRHRPAGGHHLRQQAHVMSCTDSGGTQKVSCRKLIGDYRLK